MVGLELVDEQLVLLGENCSVLPPVYIHISRIIIIPLSSTATEPGRQFDINGELQTIKEDVDCKS